MNLQSDVNNSLAWFQGVLFGSVLFAIAVFFALVYMLSRLGLLPRTGAAPDPDDHDRKD